MSSPVLSYSKTEWVPLQPATKIHPPRSGHAAFLAGNGVPFVFGGYAEVAKPSDDTATKTRHCVNDLWKYTGEKWQKVDATGDIPDPRLVAAMACGGADNNKVYLFGGWNSDAPDPKKQILDTVHELDLTTMEWKLLDCSLPDGPTSRHVAIAIQGGNKIVLHTHRCADYILLFDCNTFSFSKIPTSGPCPSSRGLHAATVVDDNICLFGGAAQDQTMSNECFLLDTASWVWTRIADNNKVPSPRAGPCLCSDGSAVFLFGGAEASASGLIAKNDLWKLHLEKGSWEKIEEGIIPPPSRNAATLSATPNGFLLTGGWNPFVETRDDCYLLRIKEP